MRLDVDRHEASKGARSTCACCSAPIVAKCGSIVAHHWAHERAADCDSWYDTGAHDWHLWWQRQHPDSWCERVIGCHRADLFTPDGLVVELQHSPLSPAEIAEREDYYRKHAPRGMMWVWDARDYAKRIEVTSFERTTGLITFRWKSPRKSVMTCRARQWWDIGEGWAIKGVTSAPGKYVAGCGRGWLAPHDDEAGAVSLEHDATLRRLLTWRGGRRDVRMVFKSSRWYTRYVPYDLLGDMPEAED